MRRHHAPRTAAAFLLVVGAMLAGAQVAGAQQPEIQRKLLLAQDLPAPGYQIVTNIVEIPAGVSEMRHTHPGILSGYVLEGTLILENDGHPRTTYKAGEAFHVDPGTVHQGINTGHRAGQDPRDPGAREG
jgi:quercetin dioxygenase-like cupin family protein